jgi:hypothetical protein
VGDGLFNQLDMVAALQAGLYLAGPYAAGHPESGLGRDRTAVVQNGSTIAMPEPSTLMLLAAGLLLVAPVLRRREQG